MQMLPAPEYTLDDKGNLTIPAGTSQDKWAAAHATVLRIAKHSRRWLDQSRDYGVANFGEETVTATESQALLDLGINLPPPKPNVNGEGKARGIASIQGISQSFSVWRRTVDHLIPKWKPDQIREALGYLEPIEAEAKRLRSMLES